MDFLDLLRQRLETLLTERSGLNEQAEAIFAVAASEQRSDLTDAEEASLVALRSDRDRIEADIAGTEARIADIESARRTSAEAATKVKHYGLTVHMTDKRTGLEPGAEYGRDVVDNAKRAIEHGAIDLPDNHRDAAMRTLQRIDRPDVLARRVIASGRPAYRSAFAKIMTERGFALNEDERAAIDEVRAASLSDASGGYMIPFTLDTSIIDTGTHYMNQWRQFCRVVQITTDNWNGVTSAGVTASWDAEAEQVSDDAPTIGQVTITPKRLTMFVPFSVEIGGDWATIEADVRMMFETAKNDKEDAAFASLTAITNGPNGFFYDIVTTYSASAVVTSAGSNTFAVADVHAIHDALQARFRNRAAWLAAQGTYGRIRQFDSSGGAALWEYLGGGRPAQLIGRPVYESENVDSTFGSGENYILAVGDFSNFVIVDRVGMNVELVPHLFGTANNRPTGERGILGWARVGSGVVNPAAFKVLNVT